MEDYLHHDMENLKIILHIGTMWPDSRCDHKGCMGTAICIFAIFFSKGR